MRFHDFTEFTGGDDAYFAHPALGSTALKGFVDPTPLPKTDLCLREGTAFHWLLFARDVAKSRLVAERTWSRKAIDQDSKAEWEAWARREGKFTLPKASFEAVHKMAEAALKIAEVRVLIEHRDARIEQAQIFRCEEFPGLELRRKPDVEVPGLAMGDAKSTTEPDIEAYERTVGDLAYDLQAALYHDSGLAYHQEPYALGAWHIVGCKKPDRNGEHQAAIFMLHADTIKRGRIVRVAALFLADVARMPGPPVPYRFNARPRTLRRPTRWEMSSAEALLEHAREMYEHATRG